MKKLDDSMILEALETLAQAFPWNAVDIWVRREPPGVCNFVAFVQSNEKLGLPSTSSGGDSPMKAIEDLLEQAKNYHPERLKELKIAQLREQIAKLEHVMIGLPPYRPGTYLTNGAEKQMVDV